MIATMKEKRLAKIVKRLNRHSKKKNIEGKSHLPFVEPPTKRQSKYELTVWEIRNDERTQLYWQRVNEAKAQGLTVYEYTIKKINEYCFK